MNTRIALVAALLGVSTASSTQAQFGYFPLRQELETSDLKSFQDLEDARRRLKAAQAETEHSVTMAKLKAQIAAAEERNRIIEQGEAARELLGRVKTGDLKTFNEVVGVIAKDCPKAVEYPEFQTFYLFLLGTVAPERVGTMTDWFKSLNAPAKRPDNESELLALRRQKQEADRRAKALEGRIAASEQRALDLEDRLRYDQFERYEQNRTLNSRINNANQRLRDAEWEAAQRSRFPFIQSQP